MTYKWYVVVIVQSLSCVQLLVTPRPAALQASLSLSISQSLLKLMPIESVTPSNHLTLCLSLILFPSVFPTVKVWPTSQLFASGGQSFGASASASVLPVSIQDRFPLGLTSLILLSKDSMHILTIWIIQIYLIWNILLLIDIFFNFFHQCLINYCA